MTQLARTLALVVLIGSTASCINVYNARSGVREDPMTVERRAEQVFTHYRIPVVEWATNYRVSSGNFRPEREWGRGLMVERVDCGIDREGRVRIEDGVVEMTVTLRISRRGRGTQIGLVSEGRLVPRIEDAETARCRLSDAFAEEVLAAIAGSVPGSLPPGGDPVIHRPGGPPS